MDPSKKNGVIETSTGDLLRFGYADFENDGRFNPPAETLREDVPSVAYYRGQVAAPGWSRWTGSAWEIVTA